MIKDRILRFLFIPLLGIVIPYLSHIVTYSYYTPLELVAICIFFIGMSWSICTCTTWLHRKVRNWLSRYRHTFIKISTVSLTNALSGGVIAAGFTMLWYEISKESFRWTPFVLTIILFVFAVIVFTLLYEILFLSKERELDSKMVDQLGWERNVAELSNLKNELEPHFIFNCLNTLSYLILNDPATAHAFNSRLASVYKYFLMNKDRDIISLHNEIEFIDNYFFLIQLRYDNQLSLTKNLEFHHQGKMMVPPFALQVAVENAVKHNGFNIENPLQIFIEQKDDFLFVKNYKNQKTHSEVSTGIGLKNLRSRYLLFCKKDITIENNVNEFILKLPLIHQNTAL